MNVLTSVAVKVCGCRPDDGGAADTWVGVRKPSQHRLATVLARGLGPSLQP
jgi:hypothetical protein